MVIIAILIPAALANSGCGYVVSGLAVETRDDAPTDAELLIDATFPPTVAVVEGPNGVEPLQSEALTVCEMTGRGLATVSPPASGWEPDATYTVEVQPGSDDEGGPVSFTFATTDVGAEAPGDPSILSVAASDWSEETKYAWGCCKPTRVVTITVEAASPDPWSYLRLRGEFGGPSQITTQPVHGNLDVAVGPGVHDLTYVQWRDDGDTLEPRAFEVSQFAANGAASEAQRVEIDLDGTAVVGDDTGPPCCKSPGDGDGTKPGCATVPNAASMYAVLAALAMARRRSR
jgi:hypothetical protein